MTEVALFATTGRDEIERALGHWPSVSGRLKPHAVSALGDIFFERPDGSIHRLDPLEGCVTALASSVEQFNDLLNDQAWVDGNLMPDFLELAAERGITREEHQVFAFAPHPVFTGALRVEQLTPMNLDVWHGIASQLFLEEHEGDAE